MVFGAEHVDGLKHITILLYNLFTVLQMSQNCEVYVFIFPYKACIVGFSKFPLFY